MAITFRCKGRKLKDLVEFKGKEEDFEIIRSAILGTNKARQKHNYNNYCVVYMVKVELYGDWYVPYMPIDSMDWCIWKVQGEEKDYPILKITGVE